MEQLLKKLGIVERDLARVLILLRQKQLIYTVKANSARGEERRQLEELLAEIDKAVTTLAWIVKDNAPGDQPQTQPAAVVAAATTIPTNPIRMRENCCWAAQLCLLRV